MFIKASLVAALASLSLASPAPLSDVQARGMLAARDGNGNTNGSVVLLFPETGASGYIVTDQQALNYCQQFQPVYANGFNLKGYASANLVTSFYKNQNCAGTPALTVSKANGNEVNTDIHLGYVYSFQSVYKQG